MLQVGAVVAGYRIERVLGAGGMGAVYLAHNPTLPRRDALKILSAELSRNDEFRTRFIREADVAAGLDHPNIVSIYRRGETEDGQLWIAMTYVDGPDADQALRAGTMTPARAMHIISDIAAALDYAHQRNVVHRDIKPANLLLSQHGGNERALLADFGIARALDDVGVTATNSVMATVTYAAPEVLAGVRFDHRADLYSLGCSLFRLLTGKTPFPGEAGVPALMLAHMQQPPPRVTDWRHDLPAALDDVIATAMAKNPAHRFATAGELAAAARTSLQGAAASTTAPWQAIPTADVSSYPGAANTPWWMPDSGPRTQIGPPPSQPGAPYQPPPRTSRRRAVIAATAAVTLLAVGGVTAAVMTRRSDDVPPPPHTATKTVPKTALAELLLNADEIDAIMGAMLVPGPQESLMAADSDSMVEKECAGADSPRQNIAYRGSGWQAVAARNFTENTSQLQLGRVGTQAVVSFPTAGLATDFANSQKALWARCSNGHYTAVLGKSDGKDLTALYTFGNSHTDSDGVLSITVTPQGAEGWACGHSLVARNNIVVDASACSHDNQEAQAINIAKQISAKVGLVE